MSEPVSVYGFVCLSSLYDPNVNTADRFALLHQAQINRPAQDAVINSATTFTDFPANDLPFDPTVDDVDGHDFSSPVETSFEVRYGNVIRHMSSTLLSAEWDHQIFPGSDLIFYSAALLVCIVSISQDDLQADNVCRT